MLNFKLFLEENNKKNKEIPEWFYVTIGLSNDLVSGPSESAPAGTAVTLNNLEGITTNAGIVGKGSSFYRGVVLKMPGKKTLELNKLSKIQYDNPDYTVSKGFRALKRVKSGYHERRKELSSLYLKSSIEKLLTLLTDDYQKYFDGDEVRSVQGLNLSHNNILDFILKFNPSRKDFIWKNKKFSKKEEKDPLKLITSVNQIGERILKIIKIYNIDFYNEMKADNFKHFNNALKKSFRHLISQTSGEQEWVTKRQPIKVNLNNANFVIPVNQLHVPLGSSVYINLADAIYRHKGLDVYDYFKIGIQSNANELVEKKLKEKLRGLIVHFLPNDVDPASAAVKKEKVNLHMLEVPESIISALKKHKELTLDNYYRLAKKNNINTIDASKYLKLFQLNGNVEVENGKLKLIKDNFGIDYEQEIKVIFEDALNDYFEMPIFKAEVLHNKLNSDDSSKEIINKEIKKLLSDGYLFFKDGKYYLSPDYDEETYKIYFKMFDNYLENKYGVSSIDDVFSYINTSNSILKKVMLVLIREGKLELLENTVIKPLNEITPKLKFLIDLIKQKGPLNIKDFLALVRKKFPQFNEDEVNLLLRTKQVIKKYKVLYYKEVGQLSSEDKISFAHRKIINLFKKHFFTSIDDMLGYIPLSYEEKEILYSMRYDDSLVDDSCERLIPAEIKGKWSITDCYEYKKLKDFFQKNPLKTISIKRNGRDFGLKEYDSIEKFLKCVIKNDSSFIVEQENEHFPGTYCLKANEDKIPSLIDEVKKFVFNSMVDGITTKRSLEILIYDKYPNMERINIFIENLVHNGNVNITHLNNHDTLISKKDIDVDQLMEKIRFDVTNQVNNTGFLKVKDLSTNRAYKSIIEHLFKSSSNPILVGYGELYLISFKGELFNKVKDAILKIIKENLRFAKIVSINKLIINNLKEIDSSFPLVELTTFQSSSILDSIEKQGLIKKVVNPLFGNYYNNFYTLPNINYNWLEDETLKNDIFKIILNNSSEINFDYLYYVLQGSGSKTYPYIYIEREKLKELLDHYVNKGLLEISNSSYKNDLIYKLKNQH